MELMFNQMEANKIDFRNQQSDSKSKKQSTQNSPESNQEMSKQEEGSTENEVKKTIPRRPQFRLNENMKRRF